MSLSKYRAFIKVIELGSFTKAAKELGYSQPGLSHIINSLEKEIGFPLLVKNKYACTPTENGKRVLCYCYQIVKIEDNMKGMVQAINGILSGNIRIGSFKSLLVSFVPSVVDDFSKAYSQIEFQLQENSYAEIQECLKNNIIDIGFMHDEVPKGFEFIHLFKDPVCLLVNRNHPLATYDSIPIKALNGIDFIMPAPGYDESIRAIQKKELFSPNIKHYAASETAITAMVSSHLGISVLSRLQSSLLPANVVLKEISSDVYRTLGIAIKSLKNATPAVKEFVRISKEAAKKFEFY
jgi:DNA-binding transcriptional LysR family regulator